MLTKPALLLPGVRCPHCGEESVYRSVCQRFIVCRSCHSVNQPVDALPERQNPPDYSAHLTEHTATSRRTHETGAVRSDDAEGFAFDLLCPLNLLSEAANFAVGTKKYSRGNYLKGFKFSTLFNHAFRHLMLWQLGDKSDRHLQHCIWNLQRILQFSFTNPELDDRLNYNLSEEKIAELVAYMRWEGNPPPSPQEETNESGSPATPAAGTDATGQVAAGKSSSAAEGSQPARDDRPVASEQADATSNRAGEQSSNRVGALNRAEFVRVLDEIADYMRQHGEVAL